MSTQYGFYIDSSRCTGCKTCELACKDFKNLSPEVNFRRIYEYAGGDWTEQDGVYGQNVFAYYLSISCNHCADPMCVKNCPTTAMHKREGDGIVMVNTDKCVGCGTCAWSCPYGAPQMNPETKQMSKCDFCIDLQLQGQTPVCVATCPLGAIQFGPIDELRERFGSQADVKGLPDSSITHPNLVIHPHQGAGRHTVIQGAKK